MTRNEISKWQLRAAMLAVNLKAAYAELDALDKLAQETRRTSREDLLFEAMMGDINCDHFDKAIQRVTGNWDGGNG